MNRAICWLLGGRVHLNYYEDYYWCCRCAWNTEYDDCIDATDHELWLGARMMRRWRMNR